MLTIFLVYCHSIFTWSDVFVFSQECLRACQESIEQVITANLSQIVQQSQPETRGLPPKTAQPMVEQSTTPTDVRDINLMAVVVLM